MNLERARFNMVEQQIRPWNVLDPAVLDVLQLVKRERFVPSVYQHLAFADTEIPLDDVSGARMFAPKMEARALQALAMKPHEKVLEIGTGSGYMAALLALHADHVWSLELNPTLAERARINIDQAGVTNISVLTGDGLVGLEAHAPFDVIMISGAVAKVPDALLAQLKTGGRLLAFTGHAPAIQVQLITRTSEGYTIRNLFETVVEALVDTKAGSTFSF